MWEKLVFLGKDETWFFSRIVVDKILRLQQCSIWVTVGIEHER